jgi:Family of unknown function (DUF6328)
MCSGDAAGPVESDPGRNESTEERADRNLTELLHELRVAGLGIQVLFGFLWVGNRTAIAAWPV